MSASNTDASRAAFEAWAQSEAGGHQSCSRIGDHDLDRYYVSFATCEQFGAWQASRKAAREEVLAEWADHMTRMNNAIKELLK